MGGINNLLRRAREIGLVVSAEDDRLKLRGPRSAEPVARLLLENKPAVLAALEHPALADAYTRLQAWSAGETHQEPAPAAVDFIDRCAAIFGEPAGVTVRLSTPPDNDLTSPGRRVVMVSVNGCEVDPRSVSWKTWDGLDSPVFQSDQEMTDANTRLQAWAAAAVQQLASSLAGACANLIRAGRPNAIDAVRWHIMLEDAQAFLETWGAQAERLGWTAADLFGLHPTAPLARYDCMGLVWLLRERPVVALTESEATIRANSGATLTFRRVVK